MSDAWSFEIGVRPYRVVAKERLDRGGQVYLRWWDPSIEPAGNWATATTGLTVRSKGELSPRKVAAAEGAAAKKASELQLGVVPTPPAPAAPPLTIRDGLARAIDPDRGKYPADTMHRREVIRELERAAAIWAEAEPPIATWNAVKPRDIKALYRRRARQLQAQGHVARRGTEITVSRVLAVAEWLRSEELIEQTACIAPRHWKEELGGELGNPKPKRLRHTMEETLRIMDAAPDVDPRLALALELGFGLRPGQVVRVRRSDLQLAAGDHGVLQIKGVGKKRGETVVLNAWQRELFDAALTGYLAPLAAQAIDYPLFPEGQLVGGRSKPREARCHAEQVHAKPMSMTAYRKMFRKAESLGGVKQVKGRVGYGPRRATVDGAKEEGVLPGVLKRFGGWTDSQIPDAIYADEMAMGERVQASDLRLRLRRKKDVEQDTVTVEP